MKKLVLLSFIASSALFAEAAVDMLKEAAMKKAKSEIVKGTVASDSNVSKAKAVIKMRP